MPSFDEFLNALKENIEEFARANWNEYVNAVVDDSDAFLNKAKKDMERWTGLLAMGQLTKEDFEWHVNGKKDLAEMEALK